MASPDVKARHPILRTVGWLGLALGFAAAIVGLMLLLAGYFEKKVETTESRVEASRPVAGKAVKVERIQRPRLEAAVGTVRAVREALIASKILARIEEVRVHAGQLVQQGEVLVVLDSSDLKTRIDQALAAERAAKARFDQAEIEQGRNERLRKRETIPQSELDKSSNELRASRAELERARRAVEESKILESFATIRAPFRGRVIDKKASAGETAVPGQALLSMFDPDHMQLVAIVRESLALRLKVGQPIAARLDAFDYSCTATIDEIVPEAQVESRSFQVKLSGPCPPNVYSGMFGRVFIPVEDESILVVPRAAVHRVGQVEFVEVASPAGASRRFVRIGREIDDHWEILAGLKEGEQVVLPAEPDKEGRPS